MKNLLNFMMWIFVLIRFFAKSFLLVYDSVVLKRIQEISCFGLIKFQHQSKDGKIDCWTIRPLI